jgi:hypothetical protein
MKALKLIAAAAAFFILGACNNNNKEPDDDTTIIKEETRVEEPAPAPVAEDEKGTKVGVSGEGVSVESKDVDVKANPDTASIQIDDDKR